MTPYLARYDNAAGDIRKRCREILEKRPPTLSAALEHDRLMLVSFKTGELVLVLEADPTRQWHPGDESSGKENFMYLKLLKSEKVVEVYASKLWVSGFRMVGKAI